MGPLPTSIYDAEGVRALDRCAIEREGIPGYTLMTRAGHALLEALEAALPGCRRVVVACGAGNNGGDGYVLARLAAAAGYSVDLMALVEPGSLAGDAARAHADFAAAGGDTVAWDAGLLEGANLIVDAILGTGLTRDVGGAFAEAIDAINAAGLPVMAVDIPSGLDADDGSVRGTAIRADFTVTFVGLKAGLVTGSGPEHCGGLLFDGLGVPDTCHAAATPVLRRLDRNELAACLPPRPRSAHKGHFGHLLVLGGAPGMPGSVRLTGEAALRTGAGLVTIATHPAHAAVISSARPELMCRGVDKPSELQPLFERATHVALGPGLGTGEWGKGLMEAALASGLPLVVDADALNLLAASPVRRDDWILTPHPGEAARLLGRDTAGVQGDRVAAVEALAGRYGGVVLLKGAGTLIAGGDALVPAVCTDGNPGMASAGMGDALTGIIAALLAQGLTPRRAAETGAVVHALAGDTAARGGERGLIVSDLIEHIRPWVNPTSAD